MGWVEWKLRLGALLFRRRAERDLQTEVEFHLAMEASKHRARGMNEGQAIRHAQRNFGSVASTMERCRDSRGLRPLEDVAQDIRYALRGFRRSPGFAAAVIGTISLALGLNTALFTLFNAYVLRPLPVRDPFSLYTWADPGGAHHRINAPEFEALEHDQPAFAEVIGAHALIVRSERHLLPGALVTERYFDVLGVDMMIGRPLLPRDRAVIVLSAAAWRNKFGGDPAILGRRITVRGIPLEVVGVAKPGFAGVAGVADFWTPASVAPQLLGDQPLALRVTGRLRDGWSVRRTEEALTAWTRHRYERAPASPRVPRSILLPQSGALPMDPRILAAFSPVIAGFALVLVIACANVANMMLARSFARRREIGTRLAIGAGRGRLVRQLLTECCLLGLAAGIAGLALSQAVIEGGVRLILATIPSSYADFISLIPHPLDARVFGFMLLAAFVSTLLFGLGPALQATRIDPAEAARGESGGGFRAARMRSFLVVAQVTVSVVFLLCASILLRANQRFRTLDTGIHSHGVLAIEARAGKQAQLLSRLAGMVENDEIATASKEPFAGILPPALMQPEGSRDLWWTGYLYTSPEYFDIFRIPILRGRKYTAAEATAGAPVAVISESTARRWWPDGDGLGKSIRITQQEGRQPPLGQAHAGIPPFAYAQVIGIAGDAVNGWAGNGERDRSCVYFPRASRAAGNVLFVRLGTGTDAPRRHIEAALDRALPGAVDQVQTIDEIFAMQTYPWRALSWIAAGFGALALLLTLAGIYGVLSYVVTQRTKEIGIRIAMGATTAGVSRAILGQSLGLAGIGTALGSLAGMGMVQVVAAAGVVDSPPSFDAAAAGMATVAVFLAAGCAAWYPSRRAARIEAAVALRRD